MSSRSWIGRPTARHRRWRRAYVVTLLLTIAGCGGSTTAPSPTTPASSPTAPSSVATRHGEVSDPTGDALPDPGVPISPDVVHATVDVSAGNITFTIQFAPGTFDPSTSRLAVDLDTDQNPSTGIRVADGLGVEYSLDLWAPTSQVNILKAVPTAACTTADPCYVQMGVAPLSIVADGMAVTVPLSLLGNADGRLNFRVFAYASRPGAIGATATSDVMPDLTLDPGHVP